MHRQDIMGSRGFTLIELSIVLVIIGLIVGGVLVGQDLIRAAEIRATITQIEKYNTAVNTFYGKYQALPGDMNISTATTFGFSTTTHTACAGTGCGDGNGVIDGGLSGPYSTTVGGLANQITTAPTIEGETGVFWVDLSSAVAGNLIGGGFNLATETGAVGAVGSQVALYLPEAKLGRGNYIYVTEINGVNYYGIEAVSALNTVISGNTSMSAAQSYNIDKKIDDGFPTSGRVAAMVFNSGSVNWALGGAPGSADTYVPSGALFSGIVGTAGNTPGNSTCFDANAGSQPTYSTEINNGASANCALILRFE